MTAASTIIVTPSTSGRDGVSAVTRQYIGALAGRAPVEVWSLSDAGEEPALPAGVHLRGAGDSRWVLAGFGARAALAPMPALVLVLHVHLLPVLLPLLWRGARVVPVLHGIEAWRPLRPLERAALARAWRVLAVSHHTVARFRAANPALAAVGVRVVHSAAPELSPPSPHASLTPPFALIVARMAAEERYKGHDLLLDIWPQVHASVPAARLVVVGDGDDRPRLQARARALGLDERVRFTGRVGGGELAALYRDATVFVMPSTHEGLGLVFLEAMRAGLPCVAAPGAAEELLRDGESGLIVDPARPADVAHALVSLFRDQPLRARLGGAAAARVAASFTPAHLAARLIAALDPADGRAC